MRLLMLGVSHHTAPLAVRDQLAVATTDVQAICRDFRSKFNSCEIFVLSTCNRTEIYIARRSHEQPTIEQLRQYLADRAAIELEQLTSVSIVRENETAAKHLMHVAAGLDAMVLGESQILGQVKRAYDAAVKAQAVGPQLHGLLQRTISTAKKVRHETGIGRGRMSIASVAVDYAKQIFERFNDKTITGIGVGDMTKIMLRHFDHLNAKRLWITNRTTERAKLLADALGIHAPRGGVRAFDDLDTLLVESDIIVTATGATEPIITAARLRKILSKRRGRPLLMIDLAVPRDIESAVGNLSNIYLSNVDDLQQVVAQSTAERQHEVTRCQAMIHDAALAAMAQVQHSDVGQLIRQLRERLHTLGRDEQAKLSARIASTDPEDLPDLLEKYTQRLINKILHVPLSQIDATDPHAPMGFYAAALQRLFDLDPPPPSTPATPATHAPSASTEPTTQANTPPAPSPALPTTPPTTPAPPTTPPMVSSLTTKPPTVNITPSPAPTFDRT